MRPRILMISSEVESLARTGGLGDVVDALSLALAERGAQVMVVTPLYGVTRLPRATHRWPGEVVVRWGWGPADVRHGGVVELETSRFDSGGSRRVCLLDDPGLFGRAGIYGDAAGAFGDNDLRFAVMSRGALEIAARAWDGGPDVIHAHDWHATFAVLYAKLVMGEHWANKPVVFTIHNLAFQGVLDDGALDRLHLPRVAYVPEILRHEGNVNLMKGATALADRITTVSPTYAREILTPEFGFGLDLHLRAHQSKLVGIINGIDETLFDPRTDVALAAQYDLAGAGLGRAECKDTLAAEVGLDAGAGPLFGAVSRLTWQKGIDLLIPLLGDIVERGGRVLLVGQGDADIEAELAAAARRFPGRVAVRIAFDPPLSRRVYSGVDFFFVPSRFEPCGLTQMYAMRYGAIPIVTDVGGLHDTVEPITSERGTGRGTGTRTGTGLVAPWADVEALKKVTLAAFDLHADGPAMAAARASAMRKSFSWAAPAADYAALYRSVT
ncbi:MAG: glycogen/starch synthase [Labilithrix sp.]|nr:glycogen/starch synthase [Labilithrix sp.]